MPSGVTVVREGKNMSPLSCVILGGGSSFSPDRPGEPQLLYSWAPTSTDQPQGAVNSGPGRTVQNGRRRCSVVSVLIQVCSPPETRPGPVRAPTGGKVTEDSRPPTSPPVLKAPLFLPLSALPRMPCSALSGAQLWGRVIAVTQWVR